MAQRLNNNFQFVEVGRQDPTKKSIDTRKVEFVEIYEPFQQEQVTDQAHRCLECGNPYCEWKCPVHTWMSCAAWCPRIIASPTMCAR